MATVEKSPADLEDGGVGCRHSTALSDGASNNRTSTSSDADGRSWHSPHSSAGGGSSSYEEQNNRSSCLSGIEIVGVAEKRRESSASECSVEVDLESGVPEDKVHLAKSKRDCRICQLSFDATNQESGGVPIELGCSCKDDLAAAHKQCAEAWFKIKGNKMEVGNTCRRQPLLNYNWATCIASVLFLQAIKTCEICGSTARNVAGVNDAELVEQSNEPSDVAAAAAIAAVPSTETRNFWQGHRFLNFLLACMVFAFVISWLFHFNIPS